MLLRLLDIELSIPDTIHVTVNHVKGCRIDHILSGATEELRSITDELKRLIESHGYSGSSGNRISSTFFRGEQRLELHYIAPDRLGIRVDDAESLPHSSISANGLHIAGVTLTLPPAAQITPGRERHDANSNEWGGEWRVTGLSAERACESLLASIVALGLKTQGIWRPREAGPNSRWMIEGYSQGTLLQLHLDQGAEFLRVSLNVIRN